jgi:hypothetical protein
MGNLVDNPFFDIIWLPGGLTVSMLNTKATDNLLSLAVHVGNDGATISGTIWNSSVARALDLNRDE